MLDAKSILTVLLGQMRGAQQWFSDNGSEIAALLLVLFIAYKLYEYWIKSWESRSIQTLAVEVATRMGIVAILVMPNPLSGGLSPLAWMPGAMLEASIDLGEAAATVCFPGKKITTVPGAFYQEVDDMNKKVQAGIDQVKSSMTGEQYMLMTTELYKQENDKGQVGTFMKWLAGAGDSATRMGEEMQGDSEGAWGGIKSLYGNVYGFLLGTLSSANHIAQEFIIKMVIILSLVLSYWSSLVLFFARGLIYGLFLCYSVCVAAVSPRSGVETLSKAILKGFGLLVFPASLVGAFLAASTTYMHVIKPFLIGQVLESLKGSGVGSDAVTEFFVMGSVGLALGLPLAGIVVGTPMIISSFMGAQLSGLGGHDQERQARSVMGLTRG